MVQVNDPREDLTDMFAGLHGQAFIDKMRALALIASIQGGRIKCGGDCGNLAEYIGMQRCGAPGGPVCQQCFDLHKTWLDIAARQPGWQPFCGHCGEHVERSHIYAVGLWEDMEVSL